MGDCTGMSWNSSHEKGGLKGGFQPTVHVSANSYQVSPFGYSADRRLPGAVAFAHPKSSDGSKIALSSPSNSSASSAAATDYIQCALSQQLGKAASSLSRSPSSLAAAAEISEQVENDVQRILQECIEFVPAQNSANQLLTKVQQRCTDISTIPLVKFSFHGQRMREIQHTAEDTMCEKQGNSVHASSGTSENPASSSRHSAPPASPAKSPLPSSTKPSLEDRLPEPKVIIFPEAKIKLDWPRPNMAVGCGLHNLGNTCFLNATLQCLAYTPPLYNYFVKDDHKQHCRFNGFCVTCKLQEFLPSMLRSPVNALRPHAITSNLRAFAKGLTMGRQEDAHEFLRLLIDAMRRSALSGYNPKTLDIYSQETTITSRIFGGFYRSRVQCQLCKQPSSVYDPFMDIPLDIGKNVTDLQDALRTFTRTEQLTSPNNLYKCERCKKMTPATKQVTIHKPPNILTLQFKRFLFTGMSSPSKLDKAVGFPERLNLRPFMSASDDASDVIYKLYAVLVHSGGSCHSGHYYSYVNPNGTWHRMDDTQVYPVNKQMVLSQRAYLLFYVRIPNDPKLNCAQLSTAAQASNGPKPVIGPQLKPPIGPQLDNRPSEKFAFSFSDHAKPASANNTLNGKDTNQSPSPSPSTPAKSKTALSFAQRSTPMFTPRVLTCKPSPAPQKSLPPSQSGKSLVPYPEDDEDVIPAPEPASSKSSASSTSSESSKENREFSKSVSPAKESAVQPPTVDSPSVAKAEPMSQQSSTVSSRSTSSESSAVEERLAALRLELKGGTMSKKDRRRLKKLERRLRKSKERTVEDQVAPVVVSPENDRKRKKKKNKRQRNSSGSTTSSSASKSEMVWVEKDKISGSGPSAAIPAGNEPQPEPTLLNGNKKFILEQSNSVYGADVRGWNGERSLLDSQADLVKSEQRKRLFEESDPYEEELDVGRTKKVKYASWKNGDGPSKANTFQRFQNGLLEDALRSKSMNSHSGQRDVSRNWRPSNVNGQNRRSASR
ncbi:ubiquitin carboxyl-terminal hydrolase 36-like [Paramacrobiotus metropolitanus]|uniref:ubiquitin carboxyl-terminal hydrolase 36-like n=1 Tax=Paramacrobiotus metropolitanus TaxID=2943436 RepID=UPI002445B330|nr:ubiquitin carboxyl-terminal hydrolase 36-like [Paramacrobiotus metropolitanus]